MRSLLPLCVAALLAALPAASAHAAPAPPEPFTRLLADYSDDCGPTQSLNDCRNGDDLVALDVQEVQDFLVFRFILDEGNPSAGSPVTNVLTLNGPDGAKSLSIRTTDDRAFSNAGGFDSVEGAKAIGDGTRFAVLAKVRLSSLGASVGDKISGFALRSEVGGKAGDTMPGLCSNTVTPCAAASADASTVYTKPDYTLRGPGYYAELTGPRTAQVATAGQDLATPIMLNLRNSFRNTAQTITITATGADGVTAGFHAGGDGMHVEYKPQVDLALEGGTGTVLHLNLRGERAGASGTLTITAATDLGGRTVLQLPYTVQDAGSATAAPTTEPPTSKGSPAPAAALAALALLGAALRRRA